MKNVTQYTRTKTSQLAHTNVNFPNRKSVTQVWQDTQVKP